MPQAMAAVYGGDQPVVLFFFASEDDVGSFVYLLEGSIGSEEER